MMSDEAATNLVIKRHDLQNRIESDPSHAGEYRVELENVGHGFYAKCATGSGQHSDSNR